MKKQLFLSLALLASMGSSVNIHADGGWDEICGGVVKAAGCAALLGWGNYIRQRQNTDQKVSGLESYLFLTSTGLAAASFTNSTDNMTRVGIASGIFGTSYFLTNRPIVTNVLKEIPVIGTIATSPSIRNRAGEQVETHGVGATARGIIGYMALRQGAIYLTNGEISKYLL